MRVMRRGGVHEVETGSIRYEAEHAKVAQRSDMRLGMPLYRRFRRSSFASLAP